MSVITETDILQKFSQLSDAAKQRVAEFIGEQTKAEEPPKKLRPNGWLDVEIVIPDNFDEPMEEFREYI